MAKSPSSFDHEYALTLFGALILIDFLIISRTLDKTVIQVETEVIILSPDIITTDFVTTALSSAAST